VIIVIVQVGAVKIYVTAEARPIKKSCSLSDMWLSAIHPQEELFLIYTKKKKEKKVADLGKIKAPAKALTNSHQQHKP